MPHLARLFAVSIIALCSPATGAAPQSNEVLFDSEPAGAEVRVDGKIACARTPCKVRLTSRRSVSMRAADHLSRTAMVDPRAGRVVRWVLEPEFGSVYVESRPPGLLLHVDGKPAQATPTTLRLKPGNHSIRLMSPCHDQDVRNVAIQAGQALAVGFDPEPRMRTLDFRAEDADGRALRAEILIGGAQGRVIGATPGHFKVPYCERAVTLRHPHWGRAEVRLSASTQMVRGVLDGSYQPLLRLGDHILASAGSTRPRVLVTLINEFNCRKCRSLRAIVASLRSEPDVHVTVIHNPGFRNRHARLAARAALAAGRQGRFWEMFARLHRHHANLGAAELEGHARALNLEVGRYRRDMDDPSLEAELSWHRRVAWDLMPRDAPAAYVNGERRDYIRSSHSLAKTIASEREAVVRAGWTEVLARIRDRNPKLAGFLVDGVKPSPEPLRVKRVFSPTVWKVPLTGHEPVQGGTAKTALATLILFKNYYDCVDCVEHHRLLARALARFGDSLRIVHKQSAPPSHSPSAVKAARLTECARRQGKYFAFDALVVAASRSGRASHRAVARAVSGAGLDTTKLATCLKDPTVDSRLDEDAMAAIAANVARRPVLFVNGRYVNDAPLWEDLEQLITDEMARASAKLASGTPRGRLYTSLVSKGRQTSVVSAKKVNINRRGAIRLGPRRAKVHLTLWMDLYRAPTRRVWAALNKTRGVLGSKSTLTLKALPGRYHNTDRSSGVALYCAHAQQKAEPFVRALLGGRHYRAHRRVLTGYARKAGLDLPRFESCLDSKRMVVAVEADAAEARRIGVSSAPALFINGYRLERRAYAGRGQASLGRYLRLALRQIKARR